MAITFDITQNINSILFYNSVANSYSARDLTTGDYFNDSSVVGDILYFGFQRNTWHDLSLTIGTPFVASSITLAWEFYNGSTWVPLTVTDGTSNFTTTGVVSFSVPDKWRWKYNISGLSGPQHSAFYIRARITALTGLTEGGANATTAISIKDYTFHLDGGVSYRISDIQTANDSGSWGAITTLNKYSSITGNVFMSVSGTSLTIRENEMIEIGTDDKRRSFNSALGTTLQIGYKDINGNLFESSMIKYWNELRLGPAYNEFKGTVNIYNSVFYMETGSFNDGGFPGIIDFQGAQIGNNATINGNCFIGPNATGLVKNTSYMTKGLSYIYAKNLTIDNLILSDTPGILAGASGGLLENVDFGTTKYYTIGNSNKSCKTRNCKFGTSYSLQARATETNNKIEVEYTALFTILDSNGNAITTPNTKITDGLGTVVFNGTQTEAEILKVWQELQGVETSYSPFTIEISKSGYETYTEIIDITSKMLKSITLKTALKMRRGLQGEVYLADNPSVGSSAKILKV